MSEIRAWPLPCLPEVRPGDDLAALLIAARGDESFAADEVLVVSQKIVSKAEGRVVPLAGVEPTAAAIALAGRHGKDPRHVEVVLQESAEVVREGHGVVICRTRHGFVCANAGVDASNAGGDGLLVLLPEDPDGSARVLRDALPGRPAVVIADSFGRAWRHGQCDVAIGVAGLVPLDAGDHADRDGRELAVTAIAVADQAAAAADLARGGKAAGHPAVVVTGLGRHVTREHGPGAAALVRPRAEDLFA